MEEIKVGDYVRTIGGYIYKAKKIYENRILILPGTIVKHSSNIIDLIEPGDYVNGAEVIWVSDHYVHCNERDTIDYTKNEINSIVTKEQFKNAECKLDN